MNILPPMMTVWHHCARKYLGDAADIVIFDCSGRLDPREVPGARVHKFLNFYAATKCNEFIRSIARNRDIAWLCDDDMFFVGKGAADIVQREMRQPRTASVSFRARTWWHFDIDGKRYEPSGSYCLALDRGTFVHEGLSLSPADGNAHPPNPDHRPPGRYDTFDLANEQLIRKGYRTTIVPGEEADRCITGFSGMSGGVMLLSYFRTPEQTLDYFLSPPKKQWGGNVLPGTLAAMLAIRTILDCYEKIRGKPYPLPSLPGRRELEKIRSDHAQFIQNQGPLELTDATGTRLIASL